MGPRAIVAVALLALAARPAAGATQSAGPVPAAFFAISPLSPTNMPPMPVGTIGHPGFIWAVVEPARRSFDFSRYDGYVADAQERGLYDASTRTVRLQVTLGLTPSWALADRGSCTYTQGAACTDPPDTLTDWTEFLDSLVTHYNGVTMPHIQYYELWNEANMQNFWSPPAGLAIPRLLQMAHVADSIIHRDPYSQLLTPSVASSVDSQATWMTAYLLAGGWKYADGGVYHGYLGASGRTPYPMPEDDVSYGSCVTKATRMRAVFDSCGLAGKPMYMTEGSWGKFNVRDSVTQVAWLARYELLQAGMRSTTNLQMVNWFCWGDSTFGWGDLEDGSGAPTAAARAYEQVYDWVVGATIASPAASNGSGRYVLTLTRPGGYVGKAVWDTTGAGTFTPGPNYTQYRDLAGNMFPITPGQTVATGSRPLLFEKGTLTDAVPAGPALPLRLSAWPALTRTGTRVVFGRELPASAHLRVFDALGRVVRTLAAPAGSTSLAWDGRAESGRPVPDGVYFLRLASPAAFGTTRVVVAR